jgi:preprotein translocase subunit YajC
MELLAVPMASSGGGSGFTLLLPLILIVGMIWFMSRTQRTQRQKQADTVAALSPGTKVVTTSGMVGVVEEVDDEYVTLEVSDGILVQFVKAAVGRVLPEDAADEELTADAATEAPVEDRVTDEVPERDTVDVPETGDTLAQEKKLPPTHTEN